MRVFSLTLLFIFVILSSTCYAVKDPSLVLYCPFNEGSGDTTKDQISGLVGQLNGAKWSAKGKVGNAVEFAGTSFIEFPVEPVLDITGTITMEAWVLPNEIQADSGIMGRRTSANVGGYCMQWTNAMIETWIYIGGWQGTRGIQTIKPEPGEWHHVAGVYDGSKVYQYVDGILDVSFNLSGKIGSVPEVFRIGQAQTGLTPMFGIIDEVAVYNRALSQDEISTDMKSGVVTAVSPLGSLATTWGAIRSR